MHPEVMDGYVWSSGTALQTNTHTHTCHMKKWTHLVLRVGVARVRRELEQFRGTKGVARVAALAALDHLRQRVVGGLGQLGRGASWQRLTTRAHVPNNDMFNEKNGPCHKRTNERTNERTK